MRYERHFSNASLEQLGALLELQRRSRLGEMACHITHRNRALQRGREATAGDLADLVAFRIENERAFTNRLAPLDFEADALLRGAVLQFRKDAQGTWEAALGATPLVDGEGEA